MTLLDRAEPARCQGENNVLTLMRALPPAPCAATHPPLLRLGGDGSLPLPLLYAPGGPG